MAKNKTVRRFSNFIKLTRPVLNRIQDCGTELFPLNCSIFFDQQMGKKKDVKTFKKGLKIMLLPIKRWWIIGFFVFNGLFCSKSFAFFERIIQY